MRLGIIGLGRAGLVHLEASTAVSGVEVAAVYDPAPEARRAAAAAGIESYADLSHMLDTARLDAVTICAPPADHAPLVLDCLERGLHVLCEKPLATTTHDAVEMFDSARRRRRALFVASKFRHVPEVILARELIDSGELGEPVSFAVSFCSAVDMAGRWNADRARAGGGVIIDNGCHAFDIVHFLFGSVTRVHGIQLKPVQRLAVEDSATVRVWAGEGVIGNVDLSWSWSTGHDTYLVVQGTRGTVEVGWRRSRLRIDGHEWRDIGAPYSKIDAHRRMHARFLESVTAGGTPWILPAECLSVAATVDAAYRSLRSGNWERIALRPYLRMRSGTALEEASGTSPIAGRDGAPVQDLRAGRLRGLAAVRARR
jgi:predicted dehydrogenase